MPIQAASIRGQVAFGILTIREDEFAAVVTRFRPSEVVTGERDYDVGTLVDRDGAEYRFAIVRCPAQGQGVAQDVARDMIEDLDPSWILVVGIGGAVPSTDFTLGDVVCALRLHDFSVSAVLDNKPETFQQMGGPMHRMVENLLTRLPAMARELKGWNHRRSIRLMKPQLTIPPEDSDRYYGDAAWKADVRQCLEHHFPPGKTLRSPLATAQPVASSNRLVKSVDLLRQWQQCARHVAGVEMELGGVFHAANRSQRQYPILAIRGISDIVGFKRERLWTEFACHSAASFAVTLVKSGAIRLATYGIRVSRVSDKLPEVTTESTPIAPDGWDERTDVQRKQPPIERRQICLAEAAEADADRLKIVRGELLDFIHGEAFRHPLLFGSPFLSLPLVFRDTTVLVSYEQCRVRVERVLRRDEAYPLNDLWAACLASYRRATLLPYRVRQPAELVRSTEAKRSLDAYRKLVHDINAFVSRCESIGRTNVESVGGLQALLEEAEFSLANADVGTSVGRLEAILSTAHKLILRYAPQSFIGGGVQSRGELRTPPETPGRRSALVVDDCSEYAIALQRFLEREGFECVVAFRVADAIRLVVERDFDLVITDMIFCPSDEDGAMDGRELVRAIKNSGSRAKVIVVSGYANMVLTAGPGGKLLPCDLYFDKAFNVIEEMSEAIKRLLGGETR